MNGAPRRLLLVSFVADNTHTGMGKWTHAVADALRDLGHSVTCWFADAFPAHHGRGSYLTAPLAVARAIRAQRAAFDAVVLHEPLGAWCGSPDLPPIVAMCHNVESKVFRALQRAEAAGWARPLPWSRWSTPALRLSQSDRTIRRAAHVLCLSEEDRHWIADVLGRARDDITVTANGVEADLGPKHQHANGRVLFVGGWLDVKGRRTLPPLWTLACRQCPAARLTLVGTGMASGDVLSEFPESLRASVTVLPRVGDPERMRQLMAEHDILLMPSLSEGSPLALLEGMAAGLGIVASQVGGIRDVVTHEVDGLLYPALEPTEGGLALQRLLTDAAATARLGAAARERVRTLTWSATAQAVLSAANAAIVRRRA